MNHMLLMSFDNNSLLNMVRTINCFLKYAYSLVPKKNINFCYIGTASEDSLVEYLFFLMLIYAHAWGRVRVTKLSLAKTTLTKEKLKTYLCSQDIIFIGGGNPEAMLNIWEKSGFTEVLNKLRLENKLPLLAGVSAGGMYPFHSGLVGVGSDNHYRALPCLGWLTDSFCPHSNSIIEGKCSFDGDKSLNRFAAYHSAIKNGALSSGYALPDDCMLHYYNNEFVCALSTRKDNKCYYVTAMTINEIPTLELTRDNIKNSISLGMSKNKTSILNLS